MVDPNTVTASNPGGYPYEPRRAELDRDSMTCSCTANHRKTEDFFYDQDQTSPTFNTWTVSGVTRWAGRLPSLSQPREMADGEFVAFRGSLVTSNTRVDLARLRAAPLNVYNRRGRAHSSLSRCHSQSGDCKAEYELPSKQKIDSDFKARGWRGKGGRRRGTGSTA